ncbi:MAG TPA: 2-amino-4-hydroxy-6-hydroxymethyldihydropteridine diphosphokinase [Anaerolineales bacterium]|nr:2-amino-4-hydroxy-6-hydroxymethyldihydropteridine diphosphokinase [Anaerolineales bacterium]
MNVATDLEKVPKPTNGMAQVYLSIGSNIYPERYLRMVTEELGRLLDLQCVSSVWKTPAAGFNGADFLNAVLSVQTRLSPIGLKYKLLRPMEAQMGRVRTEERFASRTVDIDILVYEGVLVDGELFQQPYLAVPMAELWPDYPHPVTKTPLRVIADVFNTSQRIEKVDLSLS